MLLEINKLYNMDCMDGMREFPDKFFTLAIVDPPWLIIGGTVQRRIKSSCWGRLFHKHTRRRASGRIRSHKCVGRVTGRPAITLRA